MNYLEIMHPAIPPSPLRAQLSNVNAEKHITCLVKMHIRDRDRSTIDLCQKTISLIQKRDEK